MTLKVKCDDYVDWKAMNISELKVHIALNTLPREELEKLLKQHLFCDEVTGWLYKHLYERRDIFGNMAKNSDRFTF